MARDTQPDRFTWRYLRYDLPAGVVVFLVALPLCLGIALASDAPLFAGIVAGVVGGILVGLLSGSPLSVSGPASGLTVIVVDSIETLGTFEAFVLAVVVAGLIQLILGVARAGRLGYYFPSSVIKGMLAAIGIILIVKQIPHALGYDRDKADHMGFTRHDGSNTFTEIWSALQHPHWGAVAVAMFSLGILIAWEQKRLQQYTLVSRVPGALVAVIAGTLINEVFRAAGPAWLLSGDQLVSLPVTGNAENFLNQFSFPDMGALANPRVYLVALTIAIVASLETLLCIEAADKLDPFRRITPANRELKAQGIGNMVSGLLGGLPLTAVIVRTAANANAGARTKLSAILHGLILLFSVVALAPVMNKIPLACLAGLLLMIGYKLTKLSLFIVMYRSGWTQFVPFLATIIAIQLTDLLRGIAIGMALAFFFLLSRNLRRPYFPVDAPQRDGATTVINLSESVSFLNKEKLLSHLHAIPAYGRVRIDGSRVKYLDPDVREVIDEFKNITAQFRNIQVELRNIPGLP